jgi:hypothetical protein
MSIKKLVPSSQLRARRGSNGKLPKNGTPMSNAILLAPPVSAGNMAVSVCKNSRKSVSIKGHQTTSLLHLHQHMIHHIFCIYNIMYMSARYATSSVVIIKYVNHSS